MTDLSKDELFRILSSSRRRYIIYFLHEEGEPVSLNDLATRIAAEENDRPVEEVTDSERQRVYISLYQTHLPKLEEADIISYDEDERMVSLSPETIQNGFFWMVPTETRPWHQYYAGLALLGWLGIVAVWLGLPMLSWTLVALLIAVSLLALAAAHYFVVEQHSPEEEAFEHLIE
jgi:DNA-binding transcriptional ArsR family regulator